ncbi:MAG: alpha/beta hydrolase [Anaerolineae bacterium]|nr:alpha/beta hydrolase [Anaerolineae bacterium]
MKKPSASHVIKIERFTGLLSERPLYIYLPPGYDDSDRHYPVLFMHDGQNCFEAFAADSYVGSWHADEIADDLIGQRLMEPCLIVGVAHGGSQRMAEYLPPYITFYPKKEEESEGKRKGIVGRANRTVRYYQHDILPYIHEQYRVLPGRENRATCGSSMGGLFSTYIAWQFPDFARHHALVSPAYGITATEQGKMEPIERLRCDNPRDVRLWLDSGTRDAPGRGDDGRFQTAAARDALLQNGYVEGPNFRYHLAKGAIHNESAWAARLPLIFQFLFPPR